ncbi:NADPH-dependent 7-cyano-7-deazaguanine reductase QueF [Natronoflexus pectinivorans]|uniref:7-cyano-7-deazaguanine reductase n=1 Tax=Natronoflexus pectinivorans TaxID=682526 RepID=A0A4R2GDI5_9BACT|nr:NADPH-dependent 7-cyano-7-deazaguanine reductase QueF [Natronoflexus pectinivorans]TCO05993.1 7-cyano-7-deazaguanine reductase [Natronoflexus pectinivorans]
MQPIEAKLLGQQIAYPQKYTPEILVAVPRSLNREIYKIDDKQLPFIGCDIWHTYELSFLTLRGLPVAGMLKLRYSSDSTFLVESKSLKLYLNSFNMERFGSDAETGVKEVVEIIKKDLSDILKTAVEVTFFSDSDEVITHFDFHGYQLLETLDEIKNVDFNTFNETPELLIPTDKLTGKITVATHLLRSNCKITNQPDWGSAFILLKAEQLPELKGLLQYLVSIRNENHFHEEICEMIYKRLWDKFSPEELMVACIYTRRGGIDICPVRANSEELFPKFLCNAKELSAKMLRQ